MFKAMNGYVFLIQNSQKNDENSLILINKQNSECIICDVFSISDNDLNIRINDSILIQKSKCIEYQSYNLQYYIARIDDIIALIVGGNNNV